MAALGPVALAPVHLLSKPYVLTMRRVAPTTESKDLVLEAKTMSVFGTEETSSFSVADVVPTPNAKRPCVSFMVDQRYYFVHGSIFPNKPLLKKLLGRPLKKEEE